MIGHFISNWAIHVLHATWQSAVVVVIALLAARMTRSARFRYSLLMIALVKFALPPMIPAPFGLFSRTPPLGSAWWWSIERYLVHDFAPFPDLLRWLMILHGAGAALLVIFVAIQRVRIRRVIATAVPITDHVIAGEAKRISTAIGLRRVPHLLASPRADVPFAVCTFSPVVIFPAGAVERGSHPRLLAAIAHEFAHIKSRDLAVVGMETILAVVWWWNPLYWILIREIRRAREERCDDTVLAKGLADAMTYSMSLIDFARAASRRTAVLGVPMARNTTVELEGRIRRLARPAHLRERTLTAIQLAALVLTLLLLLPGVRGAHWPKFLSVVVDPR